MKNNTIFNNLFLRKSWFYFFIPFLAFVQRADAQQDKMYQNEIELYQRLKNTYLIIDTTNFLPGLGIVQIFNNPICTQELVTQTKPWEEHSVGFSTLLKENGTYYLYYQTALKGNEKRYLALAESANGYYFTKPTLRKVMFDYSNENNIILDDAFEVFSFFKLNNSDKKYNTILLLPDYKFYLFSSSDGITFHKGIQVLNGYIADTHNQIIFNPLTNRYQAFLRGFEFSPNLKRFVRKVVSSDFNNLASIIPSNKIKVENRTYVWNKNRPAAINREMTTVMKVDGSESQDNNLDIYNPGVIKYGNAFIAFPSYFYQYRQGKSNDGELRPQFMYSHDGYTWQNKGAYFNATQWKAYKQIYSNAGMVLLGNDTIMTTVYVAKGSHGKDKQSTKIIGIYQIIDRYVGLKANNNIGYISVTNGRRNNWYNNVSINAKISKSGYIKVNLLKNNNIVNSSLPIKNQDNTSIPLLWNNTNISDYDRVEIEIKNAEIYSITQN